ncbi:MAG: spermidine synthase, partial [bacterium]
MATTKPLRLSSVAPLLLASGFCALVYQTAWTREFRLVFGASTAASAAVLAVFMGGLGLGAYVLGPRADRRLDPLLFYARLEALIALSAGATPWLLSLARDLYAALGGTAVLGMLGATLLRLLLAAVVLLPTTFLAGGTLGAAARAVSHASDGRRSGTALLYGINTFGALVGCLATTFFMLETFGTRRTLWLASLLNLLVAVRAGQLARVHRPAAAVRPVTTADPGPEPEGPVPEARPSFVLAAAALSGFAFFLMELVWYRMLGPILGGTVYTFGLVLAMALLGIAIGGLCYPLVMRRLRVGLYLFAATCLAESALLALPYVLGDRLAVLALRLSPTLETGLFGHVRGWALVAAIVILPAALVAGAQFPLLIALLGSGRARLARHVGHAYLCNTLGAILGALAGGFGLLPLIGALGAWRAAVLLLAALGLSATLVSRERRTAPRALALAGGVALVWVLAVAPGPTAAWRHSGIGASQVLSLGPWPTTSARERKAWSNDVQRVVTWEREGIESSVALQRWGGLAFTVNGKVDGNARNDVPMQVMGGLLGVLLRNDVRSSLVIGLGTGSTAGWLAAAPSMERTDVVELEPAIVEV